METLRGCSPRNGQQLERLPHEEQKGPRNSHWLRFEAVVYRESESKTIEAVRLNVLPVGEWVEGITDILEFGKWKQCNFVIHKVLTQKFESCSVSTADFQSPSAFFEPDEENDTCSSCNNKLVRWKSVKPCPMVMHNSWTIAPFILKNFTAVSNQF